MSLSVYCMCVVTVWCALCRSLKSVKRKWKISLKNNSKNPIRKDARHLWTCYLKWKEMAKLVSKMYEKKSVRLCLRITSFSNLRPSTSWENALPIEPTLQGHDTTAIGLTWALFCIGNYPEVQQQLQEEIDSVVGKKEFLEFFKIFWNSRIWHRNHPRPFNSTQVSGTSVERVAACLSNGAFTWTSPRKAHWNWLKNQEFDNFRAFIYLFRWNSHSCRSSYRNSYFGIA